jgi:hypothetical protein
MPVRLASPLRERKQPGTAPLGRSGLSHGSPAQNPQLCASHALIAVEPASAQIGGTAR